MKVSIVAMLIVLMPRPLAVLRAQTTPPVQGTVATEGTIKTFYRALNTVVVTTADGVEHVYHVTKDLVVHGGKGTGVDALAGLREGSTVVIHHAVQGGQESAAEIDRVGEEGLKITEGVVIDINRQKKQITIRYADGKTETLRLTDRAAAEVQADLAAAEKDATKIVVYYTEEGGQKVGHVFKKVS
jgi:hypothetical protein